MNPFIEFVGEGKEAIEKLCHLALKGVGLEAHALVNKIAELVNKSVQQPVVPAVIPDAVEEAK